MAKDQRDLLAEIDATGSLPAEVTDDDLRGLALRAVGADDLEAVDLLTAVASLGERGVRHILEVLERLDGVNLATAVSTLSNGTPFQVQVAIREAARHLDPRVRQAALAAIGDLEGIGESRDVDRRFEEVASRALEDSDEGVRAIAAALLGTFRPLDGIPRLLRALKDESARVRAEAVRSLGEYRNPSVNYALIEALEDPDVTVAANAALTLGEVRATQAIEALAGMIRHHDENLAISAAQALASFGEPEARHALQARLTEGVPRKVERVIKTLLRTTSDSDLVVED